MLDIPVIDIGTLEKVGLVQEITESNDRLVNASGEEMDIAGVVKIKVHIRGTKLVSHEFKVLNAKTYSNVLLGRDFMKLFGSVTFNFASNRVRLGRIWINGIRIVHKEKVRIVQKTIIPARSETVITVRCKDHCSMIEMDFEPKELVGLSGVFMCKARVIPNLDGRFKVTVLNTTPNDIVISNRRVIGFLSEADNVIAKIEAKVEENTRADCVNDVILGENCLKIRRGKSKHC